MLRWILELCAHLPAKINLQWWIATFRTTHDGRIDRYYQYFYNPSRLTRFIRHIAIVLPSPFIPKRRLSRPLTAAQHHAPVIGSPTAVSATISQRPVATEGDDREPWCNEGIQAFIPSTHRRRFHNIRKLSEYHRSLTDSSFSRRHTEIKTQPRKSRIDRES